MQKQNGGGKIWKKLPKEIERGKRSLTKRKIEGINRRRKISNNWRGVSGGRSFNKKKRNIGGGGRGVQGLGAGGKKEGGKRRGGGDNGEAMLEKDNTLSYRANNRNRRSFTPNHTTKRKTEKGGA